MICFCILEKVARLRHGITVSVVILTTLKRLYDFFPRDSDHCTRILHSGFDHGTGVFIAIFWQVNPCPTRPVVGRIWCGKSVYLSMPHGEGALSAQVWFKTIMITAHGSHFSNKTQKMASVILAGLGTFFPKNGQNGVRYYHTLVSLFAVLGRPAAVQRRPIGVHRQVCMYVIAM